MCRYFIHLAYSGKNYHGWQVQENTANTVQQLIQEKLAVLLQSAIEITGCGRTDTGVHAEAYYAHFDTPDGKALSDPGQLQYKLNKILPDDIAIKGIIPVAPAAHARFDALSRGYEYRIHTEKNPFLNDFSLYRYGALNLQEMNLAASLLLHVVDFTSFSKLNTQVKTNNCKVTEAVWEEKEGKTLVFKITADRFLRNMVRAITGTLLEVGSGKLSIEDFRKIIEGRNRGEASASAPAQGLFLTRILYPAKVFEC